jgi:hypothetical protein
MRRFRCALAALLLATLPTTGAAQETAPTKKAEFGTKALNLPFGETTEVKGKIDYDLAGLWLVSENHDLKAGKMYPLIQLYRISKDDKGSLQVNLIDWALPDPVAAALKQAQQKQEKWVPSESDLQAIARKLETDPPAIDPRRRARHIVSLAKDLDSSSRAAKASAGSIFAIQSLFQPAAKPPYGQSYYVKKVSENEISGDFTMGSVPESPIGFPLPVGTTGTFRWLRVPPKINISLDDIRSSDTTRSSSLM